MEEWSETLARCLPNDEGQAIFENCLEQCPTSISTWKLYCKLFEKTDKEKALEIYRRATSACPHAEMWGYYFGFIWSTRSLNEIFATFKEAIDTIGHDFRAAWLFTEYVALLKRAYNVQNAKSIEEKTSVLLPEGDDIVQILARWKRDRPRDPLENAQFAALHEQVDLNAVRNVYQRSLLVAHAGLDHLWAGYEQFEQAFGQKHLCTRFLGEYSTRFYRSKTVYKELAKHYEGLDTTAQPYAANRIPQDILEKWRKIIAYEETNPLKLDTVSCETRLCLVYQQCLLPMAHCTEFWYSFYSFLNLKKKQELALQVIESAVSKLPLDLFLRLTHAMYLETNAVKDVSRSDQAYMKILEDFATTNPPILCPLALIQYLHFLRRHRSVHEWRSSFMDLAQTSVHATWEVFASQALTEYHVFNQTEAASKTFRVGLERFPHEPLLVVAFVNFLTAINDLRGARSLLSMSVRAIMTQCQSEKRLGATAEAQRLTEGLDLLFEKWTRMETTFGADAAETIQKLLDLKAELLTETEEGGDEAIENRPLKTCTLREAVEQFRFMHLLPCVTTGGDLLEDVRMHHGADHVLTEQIRDHGRTAHLSTETAHVVARPDVTKMLSFRPLHDNVCPQEESKLLPKCLQDLLALLPTKPLKGSPPDTDYLLTVLQTIPLPSIPLTSMRKRQSNLQEERGRQHQSTGLFTGSLYRQRLVTKRQRVESEPVQE